MLAAQATAEGFADWQRVWVDSAERHQLLSTYKAQIAAESLQVVYAGLQKQIPGIPVTTAEEKAWKRSFDCAMTANLVPGSTPTAIDAALSLSSENALSQATRDKLNMAAIDDHKLRGDPFRPDDTYHGSDFVLLHNTNRFVDEQCPAHEIVIKPNSSSVTARELYRLADMLSTLLQISRLPLMEATATVIHDSRTRWDAFFTNAMLDQFPWETYVNELGRNWLAPLHGTLRDPPSAQLRLLHPTPVVVVDNSDRTTFKPSLSVEALGWRSYNTNTYAPKWGVSLVAVLKTESQHSTGYGLLLVAKSFSVGALVRDTEKKSHDVQIMLGVDVAKLFSNEGAVLGSRDELLKKNWKNILDCSLNGFDACASE
jgi:hypothetical protein